MINIKKVYEDTVVGAGEGAMPSDVQSAVSQQSSDVVDNKMINTDILGKCGHDKECGYMKDGCFHLPVKALKLQKREILSGKKKKNHKNDYIKGMQTYISETELDRNTILSIHKMKEDDIFTFVQDYDPDALDVKCIVYSPDVKKFVIKYMSKNTSKYLFVDFNGKQFVNTDGEQSLTARDIKTKYNWNGTNMMLWIVWGGK